MLQQVIQLWSSLGDTHMAERKATVRLVEETEAHGIVDQVFQDIRRVKKIDRVPDFWRALATNPVQLELT